MATLFKLPLRLASPPAGGGVCLALLALALLAACSADSPPTRAEQQRPNILLILADDLGNNDLGLFGDGSATTPNIDALAAAGVRFQRHYAAPTCRPARVELLTGKAASRVSTPPQFRGIGSHHITLAEALREGGYATTHVGKWHLGHHVASALPGAQGFDSWYGFLHARMTREGSMQAAGTSYLNPFLEGSTATLAQQQGHLTDLLTQAAVAQIEQLGEGERPWFINLWYLAPHSPAQPARRYARDFPDTPEGKYLALVAQLDAAVGTLLEALQESGQLDNTLVVFLSDNGGVNRVRDSNRPYYGKKGTFYEGGLRTPLILSQPGKLAPGDVQQPVLIRDLMPTLLGFAGVNPVPDLDGLDIRPLLVGDTVSRPERYYWDFRMRDWVLWGSLDLAKDRFINGAQVQLRVPGQSFYGPPQQATAKQLEQFWADYGQWQRQVGQAQAQRHADPDGGYFLSGDDYRRTPGFGGWTLQVPVDPGRTLSTLVFQEQQLDLQVGNGQVNLQLPGISVKAQISSEGCQLLTVSSYYLWRTDIPGKSRVSVALYLGDEELEAAEQALDPAILVDAYPPTRLAADAGGALISNHYLTKNLLDHYLAATGAGPGCKP